MKLIKKLNIHSDGTLQYTYNSKFFVKTKLVVFQKFDSKNFFLNKKNLKNLSDYKQLSNYKKKYF
jgi:hypothetical protein